LISDTWVSFSIVAIWVNSPKYAFMF